MPSEKESRGSRHGHNNEAFMQDASNSVGQSHGRTHDSTHTGNIQEKPVHRTAEKHHSKRDSANNDDLVDLSCGVWKLRTSILGAKFSNLYVFAICMGVSAFFTTMVSSILRIQLTSIQRQFNIDNAKAGLFDTASRIGHLSTILFAGHFAKKANIPFVVGFAGILQGVVLMVPAFLQLSDPYTLQEIPDSPHSNNSNGTCSGVNVNYLCRTSNCFKNGSDAHNSTTKAANQAAFAVMIVVQAFKGVTDVFHSGFLPAVYMDDNMLDKTKMGILIGINSVITELASPIGTQINGILTKTPVDLRDHGMDSKDPRFVAAWWLAFLIFGAGTLVFSIPVMLFPRKLVSKRQQEEALRKAVVTFTTGVMVEEKPTTDETEKESEDDGNETWKTKGINSSRPSSHIRKQSLAPRVSSQSGNYEGMGAYPLRRLSLLPPIDGPSERRISFDGTIVYEQPVKEKQASEQNESSQGSATFKELIKDFPKAFVRILKRPVFIFIIIDIIIMSTTMAGTAMFRSVYINYEYNVDMSEIALMQGLTQAGGQILGTLVSGWLANRVTTKMGYNNIIIGTQILSMCITPLYIIFGCSNQPIYGHEGSLGIPLNTTDICECRGTKSLLSCGADGNNYLSPCYAGCQSVNGKIFSQCSGLTEFSNMTLTSGICRTSCHRNFLLYVVLHAVQNTLLSMSTIPTRLLILRMVEPRDRSFAISVFSFCSTIMAIPAPNLFGKAIDNTCLIWSGNTCSLYNRDTIRYFLSGLDVAVNVAMMCTMIVIFYFFRREEIQMKKKMGEEGVEKIKTNVII
ncbi:hypothetical protein BsWGS_23896 [Bradybaena similaris]